MLMIYIYTMQFPNGQAFEACETDRALARQQFKNFLTTVMEPGPLAEFEALIKKLDKEFDTTKFALGQLYGADVLVTCQTHFAPGVIQ